MSKLIEGLGGFVSSSIFSKASKCYSLVNNIIEIEKQ